MFLLVLSGGTLAALAVWGWLEIALSFGNITGILLPGVLLVLFYVLAEREYPRSLTDTSSMSFWLAVVYVSLMYLLFREIPIPVYVSSLAVDIYLWIEILWTTVAISAFLFFLHALHAQVENFNRSQTPSQ